ncbi:hypothetical protein Cob_v001223 [Colletotrichum orbiculare MAFF 240422]|uniref:Uncharacterized protein n=1 Tax=Colletotrichum orbiculare (strain 104-T / ATCC 96160 / CBS 514.97 / LARS 414 / MAFF 240422) TaxID=1213857 RepID=A0A484G6K4_COLOR|nr:hypothetical protein Cob_v001223 [Colletotrichum orbiculare MAFF 240422]
MGLGLLVSWPILDSEAAMPTVSVPCRRKPSTPDATNEGPGTRAISEAQLRNAWVQKCMGKGKPGMTAFLIDDYGDDTMRCNALVFARDTRTRTQGLKRRDITRGPRHRRTGDAEASQTSRWRPWDLQGCKRLALSTGAGESLKTNLFSPPKASHTCWMASKRIPKVARESSN